MSALTDEEIEFLCITPRIAWAGGNQHFDMISPFSAEKHHDAPSWGLSSIGYDVRVENEFANYRSDFSYSRRGITPSTVSERHIRRAVAEYYMVEPGEFVLAKTVEHFHLPDNVYAVVHDKSSWIRLGLSVHNTVIEPGWRGVLTLELKNNNPHRTIRIDAGVGIAQVIFHRLDRTPRKTYVGQYQDQLGLVIPGQEVS